MKIPIVDYLLHEMYSEPIRHKKFSLIMFASITSFCTFLCLVCSYQWLFFHQAHDLLSLITKVVGLLGLWFCTIMLMRMTQNIYQAKELIKQ